MFELRITCSKDIDNLSINFSDGTSVVTESKPKETKEIKEPKVKENKEILYEIKDMLIENKENYPNEYECLRKYEREDELNNQIIEKDKQSKPKKKI